MYKKYNKDIFQDKKIINCIEQLGIALKKKWYSCAIDETKWHINVFKPLTDEERAEALAKTLI